MQPIRPILGELELQRVQRIEVDGDQVLTRHNVPALEGDFFQRLGRRGSAVSLTGILVGPEARERLGELRERFRNVEPVVFAADIASATALDDVLIEDMLVTERAGHPDCFEYRFRLREYTPPVPVTPEIPPIVPPPPVIIDETGTLIVNVVVEGEPGFDFSRITVLVSGQQEDGAPINNRPLTNRQGNRWTEAEFPAGSYQVTGASQADDLTGNADAEVRAGETTEVTIVLRRGVPVAKRFLIHFRFDSAFVEPCMRPVLRQVAQFTADNGDHKFLIVGQTDLVGSTAYNQSLSERRARSAFSFLRFANDEQAAVDEWNSIRRTRSSGVSLGDSWGAREYQQMLQDLGFYRGQINGRHDAATDAAVRAFQGRQGLGVDGDVGDTTWPVLIREYLKQDNLSVPDDRFLPNCPGEFLKWLGCSELDPVEDTESAWRPNRRTEFLFVRDDDLPADVARPATFNLPAPGAVAGGWCLNDSNSTTRACFTVRYPNVQPKEQCPATLPRGQAWQRQPAEPEPSFVVRGSIRFEDDTPFANAEYVLIAPDGEFMDGEVASSTATVRAGTGLPGRTDAAGAFAYPDPALHKTPGIFTLEVHADVVARTADRPFTEAKGPVVCKRLASDADSFDVIVVDAAIAGIVPRIDVPMPQQAGPGFVDVPPVVVVKKPHTNPRRQPVILAVNEPFVGTGTLSLEQGAGKIRFFDAPAGGNEITFDGTDNVFTADQLFNSHTIFAEGGPAPSDALGDIHLKLRLTVNGSPGGSAVAAITAVELTLDIARDRTVPGIDPTPLSAADKINPGRFLQVQNDAFQARRAMLIVRKARPEAFDGQLVLTPIGAQVRLFNLADEVAAAGQAAIALPHSFANQSVPGSTPPLPPGPNQVGLKFWVEAASISLAARDTGFQLGISGLEPDGDRVAVTAVQSDFINQSNAVFDFTGDDSCMMVSKFVTNVNLPDTATFDGPPGATPDPDTFRVQLTGLPGGQTPQVRLQTFRGAAQRTDHTFDMVEGQVGGRPAYRINEHVRLVSNAVDDAFRAHQTVLVRLEDTVRATALLAGGEIGRIELPVGRPPAETGPKAVRTCDIHFVTLTGTDSDPARTIARISEDWAQLAIRFNLASSETVTAVRNVLTVAGTATANGQITFDMTNAAGTSASVAVAIASGDNNQTIANKIAAQISAEAGFAATVHRHDALFIVLVNPRQNVDFDNIVSFQAAVVVQEPALNFTNDINLLEGSVLGLNFNDGNLSNIDMVAIGQVNIQLSPGAPILAGATGGDFLAANLPGWHNLCIIQEQAVDTDDAVMPFVAGHEVGHAIFDGGNAIHHPLATNIFNAGPSGATDTIGGAKRLDDAQNTRARARSGPATVPPLLLQR
jgi:outer membrane protein OmpA-like peptidoglycan-associated protein